jgi:hypothetical protein
MPAVAQPAHAFGRPCNDMRCAGGHLLLAAGAPEGLGRARARNPADEPFAVALGLTTFDPTDGSVQIKLGVLTATTMGSGHTPIVAGQGLSERHAGLPVPDRATTSRAR